VPHCALPFALRRAHRCVAPRRARRRHCAGALRGHRRAHGLAVPGWPLVAGVDVQRGRCDCTRPQWQRHRRRRRRAWPALGAAGRVGRSLQVLLRARALHRACALSLCAGCRACTTSGR
jgi:hypothetical protein